MKPGYIQDRQRQVGFSLVELMIAMVLSLFLIAGMLQVYLGNRQTYRTGEALSRVQENGRFAMDFLTRDIRMADYWGCARVDSLSNDLNPSGTGYDDFNHSFTDGIQATDGDGANGSDSITLAGAGGAPLGVEPPYMPTVSSSMQVAINNGIQQGDILIVADCTSADVFQQSGNNANTSGTVTHNTGNTVSPGNATGDLSKTYRGDASIFRAMKVEYTVANDPVTAEPTLYRRERGGTAQPLVEGIEQMQLLFGEDTNNDGSADRYLDAGNGALDMASVVSVRVQLLVRGPEGNVLEEPQVLPAPFAGVDTTDRRLRQVFTSTITIRNRAL